MSIGRRDVLGSGLVLLAADIVGTAARAQAPEGAADSGGGYGAAATGQQITSAFARFLSGMRYEALSPRRCMRQNGPCSIGPAVRSRGARTRPWACC